MMRICVFVLIAGVLVLYAALASSHDERVREAARKVIDSFGVEPGHVFNLGHGLQPKTPVESVGALVDEVRAYSARLRA